MIERQRDSGLVRGVGLRTLTASLVNGVLGAGIFAVPAELAAAAGPYAALAFVLCAVAIGSIAICFAEGGSRIPTSGGAYGYIEGAFGPLAGFVAGVLLWAGQALACGGVAAALADVAVTMIPESFRQAAHVGIIVGVIGAIAIVNCRGVASGARLVGVAAAIKLVPLAIFIAAGATAVHSVNFTSSALPPTAGLGRALILAFFVVTGMEGPLSASGEVDQPHRTIPRALCFAMLAITLLCAAIQGVAQGILGPALAQSKAPLADAMTRIHPALGFMMLTGAALSMFGWIAGDILGTPRLLFAFARDGMLPAQLGRLHPRSHVPHVAILCYTALVCGLALSGTFAELAVLATLATSGLYIAGCAAAVSLARRGVALAGEPLNFRWLTLAAATGIVSMLGMIALASRAEITGLALIVGVSVLLFLGVRKMQGLGR